MSGLYDAYHLRPDESPPSSTDSSQDSMVSLRSSQSSQSPATSDAFKKICLACRTGDYETVDSLLSTPNLDLNQLDEFDYSPLILSSLCGHISIVELLLKRGAVCDRDTFQGARCVYGALTDEIRDLLVSFDISKAVDMNQPFAGHIASLLASRSNKDIVFKFNRGPGKAPDAVALHRFILSARSPYFKEKLGNDWQYLTVVTMPQSVDFEAFKVVIDYIYLRTDSMRITDEALTPAIRDLAVKYQLPDLIDGVERISRAGASEKERSKVKHDLAFTVVEKARKDMDTFLRQGILAEKLTSPMNLSEEVDLEDINCQEFIEDQQRSSFLELSAVPDVILAYIDSYSESVIYFPVNKSILARSEYFDTMFKSEFFLLSEEDIPLYKEDGVVIINRPAFESSNLPIIQLSNSTATGKVATMVLSYLYHDDVQEIPLENTVELLYAADELFLERLKTMCAVRVSSQFASFTFAEFQQLAPALKNDAYDLIRVSWDNRCDKLEQHVSKMIAYNLKYIYEDGAERSKLVSLIADSAARIQERQDTDTIELVDDIRYYLTKKYAIHEDGESFDPLNFGQTTRSEDIKLYQNAVLMYEQDIAIVDSMLESLNLDA
ncbi:uncharacterized protein LODBEIA_P57790 [Lodderomyces beijingensis]|uniref:BTB domain-containing protein n=1 Tax=Lodderomyces beijingensis TaxID=1775926 RepID=A0ABP0ZVS6_9ASCO